MGFNSVFKGLSNCAHRKCECPQCQIVTNIKRPRRIIR